MTGRHRKHALSCEVRPLLIAISTLLACGASSTACARTSGQASIEPLGQERDAHPTTETTAGRSTPVGSDGSGGTGSSSHTPGEEATGTDAVGELDDLLQRFDIAITGLFAEPLAAAADDHPLSRAWLEVVVAGSELDRQVRGRILASGTDDGIRIVAGDEGISFSNVALEVTEQPDGSLEWVNCGYAPGVGVDMHTGEVRDDNRTSTRGRGTAIRGTDGELMISELWDEESTLLADGEPDPCPALVDARGGQGSEGTSTEAPG